MKNAAHTAQYALNIPPACESFKREPIYFLCVLSVQGIHIKKLLGILSAIILLNACGGSDVGKQSDAKPIAKATALGLGEADENNIYKARAGTDVVLTGRDSDGIDDPLLDFIWQQIDTNSLDVPLFERSRNTKVFTAPELSESNTLAFQLTVVDPDGNTAQDTLSIEILPVADVDRFLLNPSQAEHFYLFVSPATNTRINNNIPFEIDVSTYAYWTDRDNRSHSMQIANEKRTSILAEGFIGPSNSLDPSNRFFQLRLPKLDIDEINQYFQGENRTQRLELERVASARLEMEISFRQDAAGSVSLYLAKRSDDTFTLVSANTVLALEQTNSGLPPDGALLSEDSVEPSLRLDVEKIRQQFHLESQRSALNYYDCIDPMGAASTLNGWLTQAGFIDEQGNTIADDVINTRYVNNYDLGFGRNMFLRHDTDGNVYSYVENYPSLENTLSGIGSFATVVMEYSAAPTGQCGDGTFDNENKIVKFYSYVPDASTGEFIRMPTMNFDGRGEQFVPGICVACHAGTVDAELLGQAELTDIPATAVDLDATFMPWDLDSFLFTQSTTDTRLQDPNYSSKNFSDAQTQAYSREAQEEAFRALNQAALLTYASDVKRFEEPIRLIHGWYGNSDALPAPLMDDAERDDLELASPLTQADKNLITTLPNNTFNGKYVQEYWRDEPELYHNVFSRNCRLCHVQQGRLGINFESYEEFISNTLLNSYVFEQGLMPVSRLTMDRFWLDFYSNQESAAELLRTHINSDSNQSNDIPVTTIPGAPVAAFEVGPESPTIDDLIQIDATKSVFIDTLEWRLSGPTTSRAQLTNMDSLAPSFSPDIPGGNYELSLTITSKDGRENTLTQNISIENRSPLANCFNADVSSISNTGELSIDILASSSSLGDGGVIISNLESPSLGSLTNNGDGTVRYQLNDPFLRGEDSFRFQLQDFDGSTSLSEDTCTVQNGFGVVNVDTSTSGQLAPTGLALTSKTTSSINLTWNEPSALAPDGYNIYRDNVFIAKVATNSYSNTGLTPNTDYRYEISATLGEAESARSSTVIEDTDVSYAANIRSTIIDDVGCINCHTSHTEQYIKNAFLTLNCVVDDSDLGDCHSSMSGLGFSPSQFSLIEEWVDDGRED